MRNSQIAIRIISSNIRIFLTNLRIIEFKIRAFFQNMRLI